MDWDGLECFGMVAWFGMVLHGFAGFGLVWHGLAWFGVVRHSSV